MSTTAASSTALVNVHLRARASPVLTYRALPRFARAGQATASASTDGRRTTSAARITRRSLANKPVEYQRTGCATRGGMMMGSAMSLVEALTQTAHVRSPCPGPGWRCRATQASLVPRTLANQPRGERGIHGAGLDRRLLLSLNTALAYLCVQGEGQSGNEIIAFVSQDFSSISFKLSCAGASCLLASRLCLRRLRSASFWSSLL